MSIIRLGSFPKQFPQTYLIASLISVNMIQQKASLADKNIHVTLKELCEKIKVYDNVAKILTTYMLMTTYISKALSISEVC